MAEWRIDFSKRVRGTDPDVTLSHEYDVRQHHPPLLVAPKDVIAVKQTEHGMKWKYVGDGNM